MLKRVFPDHFVFLVEQLEATSRTIIPILHKHNVEEAGTIFPCVVFVLVCVRDSHLRVVVLDDDEVIGFLAELPIGELMDGKTFQASHTLSWWFWGSMPVVAGASGQTRWARVDAWLPQRWQVLAPCWLPQKWHCLRRHLCHCGW